MTTFDSEVFLGEVRSSIKGSVELLSFAQLSPSGFAPLLFCAIIELALLACILSSALLASLYTWISVGTNSVRSSVFGFFGDVREVRSSVLETELDVRIVRSSG